VEVREQCATVVKLIDPQPPKEQIVTFHRYYTVLKKSSQYKRRVTWVEGLPESVPGLRDVAIIKYKGEYETEDQPHGNSKISSQNYERTHPQVLKKIKD
jgi:hypothetical protein